MTCPRTRFLGCETTDATRSARRAQGPCTANGGTPSGQAMTANRATLSLAAAARMEQNLVAGDTDAVCVVPRRDTVPMDAQDV